MADRPPGEDDGPAGPASDVREDALEGDRPAVAYVAAFLAYVALGYVFRSAILNWIVGPLFLVVVLHLVPRALGGRR